MLIHFSEGIFCTRFYKSDFAIHLSLQFFKKQVQFQWWEIYYVTQIYQLSPSFNSLKALQLFLTLNRNLTSIYLWFSENTIHVPSDSLKFISASEFSPVLPKVQSLCPFLVCAGIKTSRDAGHFLLNWFSMWTYSMWTVTQRAEFLLACKKQWT